jgi:hypothetical protein
LGDNFYCAGDSFNSSLVAIVVVDPETLPAWAKSRGIKVGAWVHTTDITNSKKNNNIKIKIKMPQQLNLHLLFSVTNAFYLFW